MRGGKIKIMKYEVKTGDVFGCRTFIEEIEPRQYELSVVRIGIFKCECGRQLIAPILGAFQCSYRKCRCNGEDNKKQRHPLYRIWSNIKRRCYFKEEKCYKHYGGRGIIMCDEWLNDFEVFFKWAIDNKWERGLEIDRSNNDGSYSPENCRIVTTKENANNKRNTKYVEYLGKLLPFTEALELAGIQGRGSTIRMRMKHKKMTFEEALKFKWRKISQVE